MIYVKKPHLPDRSRLDHYIDKIYQTNLLTNEGPLLSELTGKLRSYFNVEHLLLVSSGTVALQIAIKLLDLQGEVVTTPFTFPATSSVLAWEGGIPKYADICPENFNIDPEDVERKLTNESKGILATHVYGNPCDIDPLEEVAAEKGIPLIFDGAQSFGVMKDGESVLNRGDISVVSFHATKTFHTVEGGALVFKDYGLFSLAKQMINFGYNSKGRVASVGINAKMNEFEAAMGLAVLEEMPAVSASAQQVHKLYDQLLSHSVRKPSWSDGYSRNYCYYPILLSDEAELLQIVDQLNEQEIVPRRYFWPSLDELGIYGPEQSCATSRDIASRVLCLPIYAGLDDSVVRLVSRIVNNAVAQR